MASLVEATLRDTIETNEQRFGDELAYVFGQQRLTHAAFADRVKRLGSALHALGARSQTRIGLLGMNSLDYCTIYGACEFQGFIASTVNFRLAAEEMAYIIGDAAPMLLAFDAAYTDAVASFRSRLTSVKHFVSIGDGGPAWATPLETLIAQGDAAGADMPAPRPADIAFLIYTSGTTGRPKGTMISQNAAANAARIIGSTVQLGPSDRSLIVMPSFHIGGKNVENAQRYVGGTVVLARTFNPEELLRAIQQERITVTLLAPTMIQTLLNHPALSSGDIRSLRAIIYSAAPMPLPVLRRAIATFGPIFVQQYGQTEGMGTVLPARAHRPDGDPRQLRQLQSVGHAMPECRIRVVDEDDRPLPANQPGELCLQGPFIMSGYWNNTPATLEALRGGWLHTGDIATIDADGYTYLVDRKKDVIISGGENIYSLEVENALLQHASVESVAVIGIADAKWGEAVCAVVVSKPHHVADEGELIAHCRTLIAGYKAPKKIIVVEELPRLPSGKIAKNELRKSIPALLGERAV